MVNVHIVKIITVVWVRIVQKLLETEMMSGLMTGTKRGGLGMTPSYRRERLVVNRKTPKTTANTKVVVVKEMQRVKRCGGRVTAKRKPKVTKEDDTQDRKDKEQSRLILNSGTCNRGENARHLRSYGMRSVGGTRQLQTCSLTPSPTPVRAACRLLFGACLSRRRRRRRAACPTPRPPRMSAWSCNTRLCTSRNTVHGRFLCILLKQCASKPTRGSPSCAFWAARTCETCT